jgi:8-oxo-dGTP pyrophosphatase MutT (NUDIX family)
MDSGRLHLAGELARHEPADRDEARHLAAIIELVRTTPRCFDRTWYTPGHLTGSAFVLDPATGRVLLHHHRRLGRWLQLGGHDDGEHDLLATALREGREESGLADLQPVDEAILDVDVHAIPAGRGEPAHLHLDVRYLLVTAAPGTIQADVAESHELAWFTPDEAVRLMDEPGSARALRKLR